MKNIEIINFREIVIEKDNLRFLTKQIIYNNEDITFDTIIT
jgi:hypothetical protein